MLELNNKRLTLTKQTAIPILILLLAISSCSSNKIVGTYKSNFASYGRFLKTLNLNCDSTFVMNFYGDFMNDNSYGKWTISGDTLIMTYDTINYTKSRYFGVDKYLIKNNKLTSNFSITKEKYDELVALIEKERMTDSLKIGSYSKFKRITDKTPANFQGKMKKQYLKKVEEKDCGK
jgi:hypothetical protein